MTKQRKIQTLIFSREVFKCKKEVFNWIKKKKYYINGRKPYSDKNCYRVQQLKPSKFNKSSLKCVRICRGVEAVKGFIKKKK